MNTDKPLLLIFSFEQLAHYLRCLTLAKKLAPHFDIRVAYSRRYASFVEAAGFKMFPCKGLDADAVLACVKKFDFSWLKKEDLETTLNQQIAALEKWKPALVLGDTIPTLKMAAEAVEVPYVSLMNGYMSPYYAGVRTMSWRYPLYQYFKFLPEAVLNPLTKWGEKKTFYKIHEPFKALRQQYGLLKKSLYAEELEGDVNFLCDLPDIFPQQNLPSYYHLIPPLIYEPTAKTHGLLKKLDAAKKTLFVSMGSTGDWREAAFLNERPFQKYNIITAGDAIGVVRGPHMIPLVFANPQQVFPHVDLVLCHGGNGTIYQALQFGIPVLCKTAHFEQEWNVQALQKKGLGASLDFIKTTSDYLQLIGTWMERKGSAPFRLMQQKLNSSIGFENAIAALQNLCAFTRTIYYENEKKSA